MFSPSPETLTILKNNVFVHYVFLCILFKFFCFSPERSSKRRMETFLFVFDLVCFHLTPQDIVVFFRTRRAVIRTNSQI